MSDLPEVVQQAGVLLQNPLALQDAEYRKMVIDWGYQQIDIEYVLDPIRAPLNGIRRKLAQMEWQHTIRTNGKELRAIVSSAAVRELEFQLQRRQAAILAADQAVLQQEQTIFTTKVQIESYTQMKSIDFDDWQRRAKEEHRYREIEAASASRSRMDESINDATMKISILLTEAAIKAMGTSSADKIIDATDRINAKILEIRRNDDLSPDEKHLQIKTLLDTLPTMLRAVRPSDV